MNIARALKSVVANFGMILMKTLRPGFFPMMAAVFIALPGALHADVTGAGEINNEQPKIEVSWRPSFESRTINLTIKNIGSKPIQIDPYQVLVIRSASNPNAVAADHIERRPGVIYPVIEFLSVPGNEYVRNYSTGGLVAAHGSKLVFDRINPGETKNSNLNISPIAIMEAKNLNKANFILLLDGKRISSTSMMRIDTTWKAVDAVKE